MTIADVPRQVGVEDIPPAGQDAAGYVGPVPVALPPWPGSQSMPRPRHFTAGAAAGLRSCGDCEQKKNILR